MQHCRSAATTDVSAGVEADETLMRLNQAFMTDGARLRLTGSADTPIEIIYVVTRGEARTIATRTVIEVAPGSSATVIETHVGEGAYLANPVTEIVLGKGARLDRIKADRESADALHLSHAHVTLAEDAVLRDFTLSSGARLNRQNGTMSWPAPGPRPGSAVPICCPAGNMRTRACGGSPGAALHQPRTLQVRHGRVGAWDLPGQGHGPQGCSEDDGKQSSHGLLLSEAAEFDAKPELEIFADDVVCGHGATSGDLNHDHLFYLQSRGIPEREAKALLIAAFAGEAFETWSMMACARRSRTLRRHG